MSAHCATLLNRCRIGDGYTLHMITLLMFYWCDYYLQIKVKPMAGSEPTTFRLQGECSSQAELHWHGMK